MCIPVQRNLTDRNNPEIKVAKNTILFRVYIYVIVSLKFLMHAEENVTYLLDGGQIISIPFPPEFRGFKINVENWHKT